MRKLFLLLVYFLAPLHTANTDTLKHIPDFERNYLYDFQKYTNNELYAYLEFAIVNVGKLQGADIPNIDVQIYVFKKQINAIEQEISKRGLK